MLLRLLLYLHICMYYSFDEHVFRASLLSESTVYLIVQLSFSLFFIKKLEKRKKNKICQHTYLLAIFYPV